VKVGREERKKLEKRQHGSGGGGRGSRWPVVRRPEEAAGGRR